MEYISSNPYNPTTDILWYGVKGMRWGIRRYQNADGSLTPAGKKRYAKAIRESMRSDYRKTLDNSPGAYSDTVKAIGDDIRSGKFGPSLKSKVAHMDSLQDRVAEFELLEDDFWDSPHGAAARKQAYDETFNWFKENEPEELAELIRLNGGSVENLDSYRVFDTSMDGSWDLAAPIHRERFYKENGTSTEEVERVFNEAKAARAAVVDEMVGKFGNTRTLYGANYYSSTIEKVINRAVNSGSWR